MRPTQTKLLLALAAALGFSAAQAAKWESVAVVKGERIEIDKSRIVHAKDGKATAWSRLALDRDFIDEYGMRYTAIEAFNRYDCERHSFATLKRVYRRDGQTVREETVGSARELAAEPGSADDMLLAEACRGRSATEGQKKETETAARPADGAQAGKPTVMYADMRTADAGAKTKVQQVADKPAEAKPEAKSGERPRYIELPKIDKSQLEEPNKDVAAKPAEAKPAAKPAAGAATAAKAAAAAAERTTEMSPASRRDLERLYASSGPRKAVRKKPAAPAAEPAVVQHRDIHWDYEGEGAPANWGKLRPDYATCASGRRQSPIDIRDGIKVDLEPIKFDYKPTQFRITDNGHTIQVDVGEGSSIKVMERQFQLLQFHFHRPSEERVNGKAFDMVAHLVHKDDDGKLAVVAVLLQKGSEHPLIQTLWNNMPLERGQSVSPAAVIDLNQLLPQEGRAYYTYMGSLTTPPCSEDVLWMVMKQPVQVSPQQVSIFARLYANNARPVQPSNGRLIKETR